jgi:hypothetical protein
MTFFQQTRKPSFLDSGRATKVGASSFYSSERINTRARRHPVLSPADCASRIRHLLAGEFAAMSETRDSLALFFPQRVPFHPEKA